MKSYVDNFLDPSCVLGRVSINKRNLVPNWTVAGPVGVFRNGGGLGLGESYVPVVFLFYVNRDFKIQERRRRLRRPEVKINLRS